MVQLFESGAYLIDGKELIADNADAAVQVAAKTGRTISKEEAAKQTMAYKILQAHNTSGDDEHLKVKFDRLTSHDITFVGIIQTARASGLEKFPVPYVLTNCHNSLCAVGGTINEDDHMFGLSCAQKYGGVYVPPHLAVIHQYAREMLAGCGKMILGSDSHTRYGALGTMACGEGGPELVKQLLGRTYDIDMPQVVAIYLTGKPVKGVGPQDIALAIIKAVFANGYVKNKVMEFVGPGVDNLSVDYRIGVDVMTTETTCLSSIWKTDEKVQDFYEIHRRPEEHNIVKTNRAFEKDKKLMFVPIVGGIGQSTIDKVDVQSNRIAQEFSRKFGGTYTQFLSPAVFSEQKAMEYFLKEKSISYIFDDFQKLDTLIMGIGIPQRVESTLVRAGYITGENLEAFARDGMAGDIALHFFDEDGNTEKFREFNDRVAGMPLEMVKKVRNRIGIAGGENRAEAIRGAIKGGYINMLITNIDAAERLL